MQPLSAPKWCAALARAREKSSAAGGEIDAGAVDMEGDGGGADLYLTRARTHAGLNRIGTALDIVERVGGAAALHNRKTDKREKKEDALLGDERGIERDLHHDM